MADFRAPDIVRVAPVPLYNTYHDAWRLARTLRDVIMGPRAATPGPRRAP